MGDFSPYISTAWPAPEDQAGLPSDESTRLDRLQEALIRRCRDLLSKRQVKRNRVRAGLRWRRLLRRPMLLAEKLYGREVRAVGGRIIGVRVERGPGMFFSAVTVQFPDGSAVDWSNERWGSF